MGALQQALCRWQEESPESGCAILVRHGATQWNIERRVQGQTDIPLNSLGLEQARAVAAAVAQACRPVAVYTSPLSRARATAELVGQAVGLAVTEAPGLLERSFGKLEGLQAAEMDRLFPRRWWDETSVPGLEPLAALQARAVRVVGELLAAHPGEVCVLVTHGAFINAFLTAITQGRLGTGVTNLVNGSISVVWRSAEEWRIGDVNIAEHMDQITGQTLPPGKQ